MNMSSVKNMIKDTIDDIINEQRSLTYVDQVACIAITAASVAVLSAMYAKKR